MTTKVLLTGFEPFGRHQLNPSAQAVSDAAAVLNKTGVATAAVELPCVFGQASRRLRREIALHRPELVICVGQASGRARIGLERVAVNIDDAPIVDNAGEQPVDLPIAEDGPAAYFSTLPVKACLRELTARQIPAEVSQSAGTYVCNHVFYSLMHELAGGAFAGTRGGFVHIPCAPRPDAGGRCCGDGDCDGGSSSGGGGEVQPGHGWRSQRGCRGSSLIRRYQMGALVPGARLPV
ncbi:pyroglutamyl-peptidase I [Arthrobacter pigmenti]